MIIDCAHYQQGRRRDAGPVPLEEAAARCNQGGFVWLGLFEPEEGELAQVRDTFGLLDLAIEDALKIHRRPKIENYGHGVQLVILRTARYDDDDEEVEFGEISVLLGPAFVITVRQGAGGELRGARQRLEQQPELLAEGSVAALWAILDAVIDGYKPVVTEVGYDIDQIEATVFAGASGRPNGSTRCAARPRASTVLSSHCSGSPAQSSARSARSCGIICAPSTTACC